MMRLIVTFLLSTFFLFVRGNHHLYAHTHHNRSSYSPAHLPEKSKDASTSAAKHSQTVAGKSTSSSSDRDGMNATEMEDEEDFTSSRKFTEITNYFLSFFYPQVSGTSGQYQKDRLPLCEHFSYFSSCKHIMQCVIRI